MPLLLPYPFGTDSSVGLLDDGEVYGPVQAPAEQVGMVPDGSMVWGPYETSEAPVVPPVPPVPPEAGDPPEPLDLGETTFARQMQVRINGVLWLQTRDLRCQVPISDAGSGSAQGWMTDPQASGLLEDDLLRFSIRGKAIQTAIAERIVRDEVASDEEAGQRVVATGRGWAAEWERALVYPDLGAEIPSRLAPPKQEAREWNWSASTGVDDTGWAFAAATDPLYGRGALQRYARPEGWPDAIAEWIWSVPNVAPVVPTGPNYFRHTFGIATPDPVPCQLWIAAADRAEVYLDGIPIAKLDAPYTGASVHVDLVLGNHFHLLAAKVTNLGGRGGLIYSLLPIQNDRLGSPLMRSNTGVRCLGYVDPPRFTIGKIIRLLVAEAQVRGSLPGWTLGFTDGADSDGNAWPQIPDVSSRVGLDYLSMLREFGEQHIDWRVSPTQRILYAYRIGEMGGASGVVFTPGVNLRGLTVERGA